jgi:hypothetical protein
MAKLDLAPPNAAGCPQATKDRNMFTYSDFYTVSYSFLGPKNCVRPTIAHTTAKDLREKPLKIYYHRPTA